MTSSSRLSIAASAKKIDVDNRISLSFYFRIANNILKQADIFREENNVIDLYVMLLRFSSLVSETMPCHRDYRASSKSDKMFLKKKLISTLTELEELKPAVQLRLEELHNKQTSQQKGESNFNQNKIRESSLARPVTGQRDWKDFTTAKTPAPLATKYAYQGLKAQQFSLAKPVKDQLHRMSLSIPLPKEETLSRHSILGPNGLRGQWHPPINHKVRYPSNLDFSPLPIPSVLQSPLENETTMSKDDGCSELARSSLSSTTLPKSDIQMVQSQEPSLISFEADEICQQEEIIRQPSPPPVLADVHDLIQASPPVKETDSGLDISATDALVSSEDPLQLHISTKLMDNFMKLAKSNTDKNLETCGVLAGCLKNRKFYITALIIPKQESTSDSCQTTNEEEIFEVQDKQSLFPLGWIHTHPTQSCFMSSIDVHTHYSYQIMLPEAIAIVMAPRDNQKNHGIFRLTSGGMTVIRHCPRRGFHAHDPPSDGSPIYRHCADVYMNPALKFDVIDLR